MSLSFTNTPEPFQPVLSDGLFFTVSSTTYDAQTTFKFRFVYELYINGSLEFQGKCSPNPFGLGIVDLQQILESYTNSLPIASWDGTPVYVHQTFPFGAPWNQETINYQIAVGYEYASSEIAAITGFTGIGNQIGNPEFYSENYKTFRSTMGVNGRATQQSFDIGPFVLSGTPLNTNPTISGLFLTNAPRIQDISLDEWYTLGFTNYYLNSGSTPTILSEPYYCEFNFYDDNGLLITGTTHDNILDNGGGPRDNCNFVYPAMYLIDPATGVSFNTLYLGVGPKNIPYFPNNTRQYTVQLYGVFEGSTSPILPTPTVTPTPTSSPFTSPTPTPSSTPPCSSCDRYTIEYTGLSEFGSATYVNCTTGASLNFKPLPTVIYVVCSCSTPTGVDLDVVNIGPCNETPTPTPTPGCECNEFEVTNDLIELSNTIQYIACDAAIITLTLEAGITITICACDGSIEGSSITITEVGPCPSPTPTPTRTPPVPTPSSTPEGYEYLYLTRDCDDFSSLLCLATNSVFSTGTVVKAQLTPGCWEIVDLCVAPYDDVITLNYPDCESCPL
jgi:hypothetical protein